MKNKLNFKVLLAVLLTSVSVWANPIPSAEKNKNQEAKTEAKSSKAVIGDIFAIPTLLPACSTDMVGFKCSIQSYISGGSWVFIWTVGPGWTSVGTITTMTDTLLLFPASPSNTPGPVSVTAVNTVNGNSSYYNVGYVNVYRSTTYSSNAVISGTNACSGSSVFTISGVKSTETVSWSVSDPAIASVTSSSNTQATVASISQGSCDLIATITNACNQTVQKRFPLYYGAPVLTNFSCSGLGHDFCSGLVEIESNSLPVINLNDKITATFNGLTTAEANDPLNWEWKRLNTNISVSGARNIGRVTIMNYGSTGVRVRASNACGWSPWYDLYFDVVEIPSPFEKMSIAAAPSLLIYPNPAKDILFVEIKDSELSTKQNKTGVAELYSLMNEPVAKVGIGNNKAVLNVRDLKRGVYVLKIVSGSTVETRRILID